MTVLECVEEYGVQSGLGAALVDRESDRTYQSTKPRRKSMPLDVKKKVFQRDLDAALEDSEVFAACPSVLQESIRQLVQDLYEQDWDNWDSCTGMDFVENLLLNTLQLPD